jgi:hypothetical protein
MTGDKGVVSVVVSLDDLTGDRSGVTSPVVEEERV